MGKKLCRYILGMRRSSDIEGVFVLTDEQLESIKSMEGFTIYYGEIAGKHSDVTCDLCYEDIEILTNKPEEVEFFERILPSGAGFNFPTRWFDSTKDRAYAASYDAASEYSTAAEALAEGYSEYNNDVTRQAFIDGFNCCKEDDEGEGSE